MVTVLPLVAVAGPVIFADTSTSLTVEVLVVLELLTGVVWLFFWSVHPEARTTSMNKPIIPNNPILRFMLVHILLVINFNKGIGSI